MCCRITTEKAETFRHGYEAGFNFRAASSEQTPGVGDVMKEGRKHDPESDRTSISYGNCQFLLVRLMTTSYMMRTSGQHGQTMEPRLRH